MILKKERYTLVKAFLFKFSELRIGKKTSWCYDWLVIQFKRLNAKTLIWHQNKKDKSVTHILSYYDQFKKFANLQNLWVWFTECFNRISQSGCLVREKTSTFATSIKQNSANHTQHIMLRQLFESRCLPFRRLLYFLHSPPFPAPSSASFSKSSSPRGSPSSFFFCRKHSSLEKNQHFKIDIQLKFKKVELCPNWKELKIFQQSHNQHFTKPTYNQIHDNVIF